MSFVWTISVDEDDIENMRKTLKLDYESLLKKTKDALTCEYSPDLSYEYKLNSQRTEFQWHYAPDEDITVICIFYIFFNSYLCTFMKESLILCECKLHRKCRKHGLIIPI